MKELVHKQYLLNIHLTQHSLSLRDVRYVGCIKEPVVSLSMINIL